MKTHAYMLAALLAATTAGADTLHYGLVSLAAGSSREVTRDQMVVLLNIEAQGKNRLQVADTATRKINTVLQAAARHKDFNTLLQSRSTYPVHEYVNNRRVEKGWQDSAVIRIQSKNMAALNAFAAQMQAHAAIGDVRYSLSEEAVKSHEAQLTREAVESFRAQAQELSRQLGGRGYKIVQMSLERSGGEREYMPMLRMAAQAKDAAVADSAPGEARIGLQVRGQIQVQGLD